MNTRRTLGALTAAVGVLVTTTACAQITDLLPGSAPPSATSGTSAALTCPGKPGGPVTLVVGARANSPRPDLPSQVSDLVQAAAAAQHQIQVVRVDGAPSVALQATFGSTAQNDEARRHDLDTFTAGVATVVGQLAPKQPEADVFTALTTAANATPSGGTIVLVDSGIPTKGQLDFLQGDLWAAAETPDEVTGYLTANHLLPDLSGRSVVLVDVGHTADPEPDLNEDLRNRVVSLWEHVASTAHAACTQSLPGSPPRQSVDTGGIGVTVVPLPAEPVFKPCGATTLTDSGPVGFVGDKAQFRDEQAARAALQPLADEAKQGNKVVTLVGTTASARTKSFRDQLSKDRAEAVKTVLESQGVDGARITTVGAGNESKYQIPDLGADGTLLPGPAAENRRVVVELACPTS